MSARQVETRGGARRGARREEPVFSAAIPGGAMGGFTLLELLVALTLMGLMTVLLMGGLDLGLRGNRAVTAHTAALEERQAVAMVLRRQVEAALPVTFYQGGRFELAFEGRADRLDFIALMYGRDGRQGLWQVRLAVEDSPDGAERLTLTRQPLDAPGERFKFPPTADRAVLLPHASSLGFAYFDGTHWHAKWHDERKMPVLVRFSRGDAPGLPWPAMIMAPRLGRGDR